MNYAVGKIEFLTVGTKLEVKYKAPESKFKESDKICLERVQEL